MIQKIFNIIVLLCSALYLAVITILFIFYKEQPTNADVLFCILGIIVSNRIVENK